MSFHQNLAAKRLIYLFSFGLLIRLVLAWLPEKYLFYLVYDDAYYYFSIARNFATRGMLSADGITLTNGFHPLWLFIITPIYMLFKTDHWLSIHLVLTLSAAFDVLAAFLIYKVLERLGRPNVAFWTTAFYLFNPYGLQHTMDGLEIGLNNFFLALILYCSVKITPEWLKTGWFPFGVICGLALLSRTDNIIIVGVMLIYVLWRDRNFGSIFKTVAAASVLVLLWLVFNFVRFGSIIQTSGTAYPWHYRQQFLQEYGSYFSFGLIKYLVISGLNIFFHNAYHYGSWILTLIVVGILFYRLRTWPEKYRPLLWTLAAAFIFASFHTFLRWSVRPWYLQTAFVLTLPAVALSFDKIKRSIVVVCAAVALFLGLREVWSPRFFRKVDRLKVILNIVTQNIPSKDKVGIYNCGYVQYFTDKKVINLDGLVNNEVLPYYKQNKGLEYFHKRDIKWLVDYSFHLWAVFGSYLGATAESSLAVMEIPDKRDPMNNLFIVRVLPDSLRPEPGTEMPIWRGKPKTKLAPLPIPFIRDF